MNLVKTSYNATNNIIDPRIISGLVQSDGSFSVSITSSPSKLGFVIRPMFSISLQLSSYELLLALKQYFGVGTLTVTKTYVEYRVSGFYELWHVIVPHFCKYPLFGAKHISFVTFVTVLTLLFPYYNTVKPTWVLVKVLMLISIMNAGSSRTIESIYNRLNTLQVIPHSLERTLLSMSDNYLMPLSCMSAYFLVGLMEGDGSFYFAIRPNGKLRFGFNITTNIGELDLLYAVKQFLGFGNVIVKNDKWCYYYTESVTHINDTLVPLVSAIPMRGSKQARFLAVKEVLKMYKAKEHLTAEGRKKIEALRDQNKGK